MGGRIARQLPRVTQHGFPLGHSERNQRRLLKRNFLAARFEFLQLLSSRIFVLRQFSLSSSVRRPTSPWVRHYSAFTFLWHFVLGLTTRRMRGLSHRSLAHIWPHCLWKTHRDPLSLRCENAAVIAERAEIILDRCAVNCIASLFLSPLVSLFPEKLLAVREPMAVHWYPTESAVDSFSCSYNLCPAFPFGGASAEMFVRKLGMRMGDGESGHFPKYPLIPSFSPCEAEPKQYLDA